MFNRLTLLLALAVVALMAVAGVNAATSKESFDLKGEVYPNYKIEFVNAADKTVKTVKAGHEAHQDRGQVLDPQLPPERPGRQQVDERRVRRRADLDGEAEAREVHLLVRSALVDDARLVPGRRLLLTGSVRSGRPRVQN